MTSRFVWELPPQYGARWHLAPSGAGSTSYAARVRVPYWAPPMRRWRSQSSRASPATSAPASPWMSYRSGGGCSSRRGGATLLLSLPVHGEEARREAGLCAAPTPGGSSSGFGTHPTGIERVRSARGRFGSRSPADWGRGHGLHARAPSFHQSPSLPPCQKKVSP